MSERTDTEIEVGSRWYKRDIPREDFEVIWVDAEFVHVREIPSGATFVCSRPGWLRLYAPVQEADDG